MLVVKRMLYNHATPNEQQTPTEPKTPSTDPTATDQNDKPLPKSHRPTSPPVPLSRPEDASFPSSNSFKTLIVYAEKAHFKPRKHYTRKAPPAQAKSSTTGPTALQGKTNSPCHPNQIPQKRRLARKFAEGRKGVAVGEVYLNPEPLWIPLKGPKTLMDPL